MLLLSETLTKAMETTTVDMSRDFCLKCLWLPIKDNDIKHLSKCLGIIHEFISYFLMNPLKSIKILI